MELDIILRGECLTHLNTFPDASIDAVVTDPPYGLGSKEPTGKEIEAYLQGSSLDTGGDFMGHDWEIPSVPTWREIYRVLKPGGYVLSFGGARTWDIISLGLRAAGFENRDTIASAFGATCLSWVYSQGFPKSLNVSKEFRKRAANTQDEEEKAQLLAAAEKFEGYGTALKPAWEPILCFRKPLSKSSVNAQMLETGTGAINIDGTRVKHASPDDFEKHKAGVEAIKARGGSMEGSWKNSSDLSGANEVQATGRWPANTTFTHAEGCKRVGSETVKAPVINRFTDGMKPFGDGAGHPYESSGGGEEEVAIYECVEGCPIKALDDQSGVTTSGAMKHEVPAYEGASVTPFLRGRSGPSNQHGGSGGASRFFTQFMPDAPFFYAAKASKSEKNDGVDGGNVHPSVKPLGLMQWLVRLVTPKGGIVLDPYAGSGTTCVAAVTEGRRFVGIEREEKFHRIAQQRVKAVYADARGEQSQRDAFDLMADLDQDR